MCTVTWLFDPGGYRLFCNRDELRTRSRATPPEPRSAGDTRFLAPTDGAAGGAWITVNEVGVSLCLLNDYSSPALDPRAGSVSRGLLVASLAGLHDGAAVTRRLQGEDLGTFRPFHLLCLRPDEKATVFHWNGLRGQPARIPTLPLLTSSGFDAAAADRQRRSLLERQAAGRELSPYGLLAFHRSHEPERGALSPCMHRPDARTVSFSSIRVEGESVSFRYADGPPCTIEARECARLARQEIR